jgi:hypothetical protein
VFDGGTDELHRDAGLLPLACGATICVVGQNCEDGECRDDPRAPFCGRCDKCDGLEQVCVVASSDPLEEEGVCSAVCSDTLTCPLGFECRDVAVETGSGPCVTDSDCFRDRCVGADFTNPVAPVLGQCELSARRCFEDADCDDIACLEDGRCLIGRFCALAPGRTCPGTTTTGSVPP